MATTYKSKHGKVARSPFELYMTFTDMRNFTRMLPEDKKDLATADFDTIDFTVQGMKIGLKVTERHPYSRIDLAGNGTPIEFTVSLHFDAMSDGSTMTDFYIEAEAELNFMIKAMIGNKIQEALDKLVDSLVAVSEGRVPDGVDPSVFNDPSKFDPSKFN